MSSSNFYSGYNTTGASTGAYASITLADPRTCGVRGGIHF